MIFLELTSGPYGIPARTIIERSKLRRRPSGSLGFARGPSPKLVPSLGAVLRMCAVNGQRA